jgi:hypothetical protein
VASKTDLTPKPDFYNAIGEVLDGDQIEVLDPEFIRYDFQEDKTSYAYLYIKVKMLSGEHQGKIGYVRSEEIKW